VGRCFRKPLSLYINALAYLVGHLHSSMMGPSRKYSHIAGFLKTKQKIGSNLDFETNVSKVQ
jgi:hypothetical protein